MRDISTTGRFARRFEITPIPRSGGLYNVTVSSRWLDAKDPDGWQTSAKFIVDGWGLKAMRGEVDMTLDPPF